MEKFKRFKLTSDEPIISLRDNKFYYNATITKLAELKEKEYLVYHFDNERREIGFEFYKERTDEHSYRLIRETGKRNNFRSSAGELIKKFSWIREIHNSRDNQLKKLIAFKRGNIWVISFKPSFEIKIKRTELNIIPSGSKGIYRYVDKVGEIVYIGKGEIKARTKEPTRENWNFVQIEYSIIDDVTKQFEWEEFWIEWFKDKNNDKLPYYNKVSGNKKTPP